MFFWCSKFLRSQLYIYHHSAYFHIQWWQPSQLCFYYHSTHFHVQWSQPSQLYIYHHSTHFDIQWWHENLSCVKFLQRIINLKPDEITEQWLKGIFLNSNAFSLGTAKIFILSTLQLSRKTISRIMQVLAYGLGRPLCQTPGDGLSFGIMQVLAYGLGRPLCQTPGDGLSFGIVFCFSFFIFSSCLVVHL